MKTAAIAILGSVLLIGGISLLVLPGPGFVLVAAGLTILATRFEWAKLPLNYAKGKAEQGIRGVQQHWLHASVAVVSAVALGGVGVLVLAGVDIPFLGTFTAIVLIVSGLTLLGTVLYARFRPQPDQRPWI